ncbi:uncharacterized protein [Physcomitrium patens]|uniref:VQ domain-containing protein n=1 Tax=Physcomitrium patens TaxID=3218 RepID=A0A2K1IDN3_PHYPA|nr:uncharacterized protein LOC112277284 [Physcomitrium patens]XP_024365185.1 uncharacterized protein LOC112277284 [Physcomitrium patens]PNR27389.1 hypothetical protein PHYPA_029541 [Physcomitrium patens]|eukprot:XP_024365184.1 uncharacterized protein LOC112277284 [Physcomitrella patens]
MAPRVAVETQQGLQIQSMGVSKDSHDIEKPAFCGRVLAPIRRDMQPTVQAPAIRVIHIFSPKIIQTDVANFRSTVQKLTGKSRKKSGLRARNKTACDTIGTNGDIQVAGYPLGQVSESFTGPLSDHVVLQRLACGGDPLVRRANVDSTTHSFNNNSTTGSNVDTSDLSSPSNSFTFPFPQRETPYSLSEIPAPFFGSDISHACSYSPSPTHSHSHPAVGAASVPESNAIHMPSAMDNMMSTMLGFDVEIGSDPLPFSDHPFGSLTSSSPGGLYDIMPQNCRSSVQRSLQGSFFESI